jgi:RNA polymerase sigma factor (sigma-70 family)
VTALSRLQLCDGIVTAARAGDRDALSSLLALAQPDIRRYARRSCKTASDIDDAVQETLFVVYRRVGSLRAAEAFSAWIFSIVDRVCLRLARRAFGMTSELDAIENDGRFATRPELDLRLDLAAALESLPQHYREIVLLRDVEELTIAEIAIRLEVTDQTAKARLHRARTLVREYILK